MKAGRGRPEIPYDPKVGVHICEAISSGANLAKLVGKPPVPPLTTVYKWLRDSEIFSQEYNQARTQRADTRNDRIEDYKQLLLAGKIPADVARVVIDAEKWQAGKENPMQYGDRTILAGDKNNPLELVATRLDEAIARRRMIDITPVLKTLTPPEDGSDLL